jgi:hypothetical protein
MVLQPEASEDIALWLADEFTQVCWDLQIRKTCTERMIEARQYQNPP